MWKVREGLVACPQPNGFIKCVEDTIGCGKPCYFGMCLAHLSQRLIGELIVYPWSGVRRHPSVVCRPQCSDIFSETAWPIKAKFYVEPPWVGGTKCCS